MGSGSLFITALLDTRWKPNMPLNDAKNLIECALANAMMRDGSSGGFVRVFDMKENKVVHSEVIME